MNLRIIFQRSKIKKIRERITKGEISFADAARAESEDKDTRNSGGLLVNPKTFTYRFELTKMDPQLYSQVEELKDNEVSQPIQDKDQRGAIIYKLLTVTNRYDEHIADYAKDYTKIKELALKEKQIREIAKWSEEKIKDTYVKVGSAYRECNFANAWVK